MHDCTFNDQLNLYIRYWKWYIKGHYCFSNLVSNNSERIFFCELYQLFTKWTLLLSCYKCSQGKPFFFLTKMCLLFLFSQIILNGQISNILNSVKVGKRSSDVYSDESCLLIAILKLKIDKESSPSFTCNFNSFMTEVPTISYRNQSIDLQSKSMDWFLYDRDLCREGVKIRVIGIITVKRI